QASLADPRGVGHRTDILNVQLHREKQRLELAIGTADIAEAIGADAIKYLCIRTEADSVTGTDDAAEIFAIIIGEQSGVPWAGSSDQIAADEPSGGLHEKILLNLAQQKFKRRQIGAEGAGSEIRAIGAE